MVAMDACRSPVNRARSGQDRMVEMVATVAMSSLKVICCGMNLSKFVVSTPPFVNGCV